MTSALSTTRAPKPLTCVLQAAVGEGQQRGVQGSLGVLQDGVMLVDVLHHLGVELILLKDIRDDNINRLRLSYASNMPKANLETSQRVCV